MADFSDIPIRENGVGQVEAEWWNILRREGIRVDAILNGLTAVAQTDILDNQSSYVDLTDVTFNATDAVFVRMQYTILRTDSGTPVRESGIMEFEYVNSGWSLTSRQASSDVLDMTDSIIVGTTDGVAQLQYKSSSLGAAGTFRWQIINTISPEAA